MFCIGRKFFILSKIKNYIPRKRHLGNAFSFFLSRCFPAFEDFSPSRKSHFFFFSSWVDHPDFVSSLALGFSRYHYCHSPRPPLIKTKLDVSNRRSTKIKSIFIYYRKNFSNTLKQFIFIYYIYFAIYNLVFKLHFIFSLYRKTIRFFFPIKNFIERKKCSLQFSKINSIAIKFYHIKFN